MWLSCALGLVASLVWALPCRAQEITFARPSTKSAITINGQQISRWQAGDFEVLHVAGNVEVRQQDIFASSNEAIIWVELPSNDPADFYADGATEKTYRIIAYLENDVVVELNRQGAANAAGGGRRDRIQDQQWLGQLVTQSIVDLGSPALSLPAGQRPPIYQRAMQSVAIAGVTAIGDPRPGSGRNPSGNPARREDQQSRSLPAMLVSAQTGQLSTVAPPGLPSINDVPDIGTPQFELPSLDQQPLSDFGSTQPGGPVDSSSGSGLRRSNGPGGISNGPPATAGDAKLAITARDSKVSLNFKTFTNPQRPEERISLGVGGVRIAIDSSKISNSQLFAGDRDKKLVILADSVVQWQTNQPDGTTNNELYLEGNVVFAKGSRVIYAQAMHYNVERSQGTILKAEVLTPVPEYRGLVRLKAEVVQQVDENRLQAYGTAFTSSRLGVPRYWVQSSQMNLTRQSVPQFDPVTDQPLFDPTTGLPQLGDEYLAQSVANRVYVSQIPVFAWPKFSTNLSDPSLYLTEFSVNNDRIFGTQVHGGFDLYKILGFRAPPRGTKWTGVLDHLSERGIGYGSKFDYRRNGLFGIPGDVQGSYKSWFINDDGLDFLGRGRFNLVPEETFRGRVVGKHRHNIAPGFSVRGELGYVSDRNFLEQFYEREWDTGKDVTTGLWVERNFGTQSYNLIADFQINDFFTQTSWLPKLDQFTLGQPIFGDRAFFNSHTHLGYGRLRVASTPTDPTDAAFFDPLAWEADVNGVRVGSRQELNVPLQLGPTKVVPYALTDFTFWQEALDGNDLFRAGGQVGVRASLPVWKVDPTVRSELLNLNGLAHKVTFDVDAFYADASQDINELPLFDALDDDAQEHFRRRFAFSTFGIVPGGDTPLQFDERFYALRSGLQGNVTSPSAEIFDDLAIVKLGARQRWQTKRGAPGRERIVDVVNFDVEGILFPNADRDNFGASAGVVNYDFRYHIGDRVSLLSDGHFDFFDQGLRTVSVGAYAQRPEVGDLFLGVRSIEGPISSNIITGSGTYRMSDKWGLKGGLQVDFGEAGTIGQRLGVVYIGESFLLEMAVNYDASRDNLGVRFGFEPRFLPKPKLFRPGGTAIAPAGSRWLE
jgi:lipopolysaccharide export system protein LptA